METNINDTYILRTDFFYVMKCMGEYQRELRTLILHDETIKQSIHCTLKKNEILD